MPENTADSTEKKLTVDDLSNEELIARVKKAEAKIQDMRNTTPKNDWNDTNSSKQDDELWETKTIIKELWFATTDELEDFKKFKSDILTREQKATDDKTFDDFTSQFNTLTDSEKNILRDLKQVYPDKEYSDILKTTNFIDQSLLEKSKGWVVMGWDNIWLPRPKEVQTIDPKIAQKMNLKSSSEIADIRSKFNI